MESRLNDAFEAAVASKKIPGVAGIALDKSGNVLYRGAFGPTNFDDPAAGSMTPTTPMLIFSCTKIVTTVAALQLIEQGKLSLSDPVKKYCPSIKDIQVLTGFKDDGTPNLRTPASKPTILHLLTHTAGFTYDFFDKPTLQWRIHSGAGAPGNYFVGTPEIFATPLAHDPGAQYTYGVNTDWLGFVIEAVTGERLDEYISKKILKPLAMNNTSAQYKEGSMSMHLAGEDGTMVAHPEIKGGGEPVHFGGGHFLYSTLDDFSTFLLTILNYGTHPKSGVSILREQTVKQYLFTDHLSAISPSDKNVGVIKTSIPPLSGEGEFMPGIKKTWSLGLMLNLEDTPRGRKAGSGAWAGLGNQYFWIDPKAGKLGFVTSQFFPFMDETVCGLFDELESAVYGHEKGGEGKAKNFRLD